MILYYRMRQILLQTAAVLLQFVTVNIMLRFYYKIQQLLQILKFITKCVGTTFKKKKSELLEEIHYKVKGSKQTAAVFQLLISIIL